MPDNLISPPGVLAFVNVFTPRQVAGKGDLFYQLTVIFDQQAQQTNEWKLLQQGFITAAHETFGNQVNLASLKSPVLDCATMAEKEGFNVPGGKFIRFKTKQQPGIVDVNLQPIIDPSLIYSGCLGRVTMGTYTYAPTPANPEIKKGVGFGLRHVQVLNNDETQYPRLDGRVPADKAFAGVAPPPGSAPPVQPVAQGQAGAPPFPANGASGTVPQGVPAQDEYVPF